MSASFQKQVKAIFDERWPAVKASLVRDPEKTPKQWKNYILTARLKLFMDIRKELKANRPAPLETQSE